MSFYENGEEMKQSRHVGNPMLMFHIDDDVKCGDLPRLKEKLDSPGWGLINANSLFDSFSDTPLIRASRYGHSHIVAYLIDKGAFLDHVNSEGHNALWEACHGGYYDIADMLIKAGSRVNHSGERALNVAITGGFDKIVSLLVHHGGADLMHVDPDGFSPLVLACLCGHYLVVRVLLQAGAHDPLALHAAATSEADDPDILALLVKHGDFATRIDAMDCDGDTPLMYAIRLGIRFRAMQYLLDNGADIHASNIEGISPFQMVCIKGDLDCVFTIVRNYGIGTSRFLFAGDTS